VYLSIFCYCNKIPESGYFLREGGLFSVQFWRFKGWPWHHHSFGEDLMEDSNKMVGVSEKEDKERAHRARQEVRVREGLPRTVPP
jgi:hypothetical protein